ncbi:MAG: TolC family protein, partial [Gemmataceae bacterium]|nr:TolC family protein [Gemmataceae bacterium]
AEAADNLADLRKRQEPTKEQKEKEAKRKAEGKLESNQEINERLDRLRVDSLLGTAKARLAEARMGAERAASALREAMGLCADARLKIDRCALPDVCLTLDKRILIDLALSRRPEIAQASFGAETGALEIEAQQATRLLQLRNSTYAAGGDIHATPLPAGSFDNNYSPAAVAPDMPTTINGKRRDRVAVAEAYAGRASDLLERTRLLIRLETEQAFLRWVEATKRVAHLREAVRAAVERADSLRAVSADEGPDESEIRLAEVLEAGSIASTARADLNRARYEALLALAQLERATAGGFCAKLDSAAERPDDVKAVRDRLAPLLAKWKASAEKRKKGGKGDQAR